MPPPVLRPLGIGEILDGAFTVYRRHFAVLFASAALLYAPAELAGLLPGEMLRAIVGLACAAAAQAPLTWQASAAILGGTPTVGDGLAAGGRRVLAVLLLELTITALIGLVTLPLLGAWILLASFTFPSAPGDPVQTMVSAAAIAATGTLALAPSALLMVRWYLAWPACVLEPGAPALRRSASLVRGSYVRLGLLWSLAWLITGLPGLAIGVGQIVARVRGGEGAVTVPIVAAAAAGWLVSALAAPFGVAVCTLAYYDQRVRREGFDVQLALARAGTPRTAARGGAP